MINNVTVIVPMYNEESNIESCLGVLKKQTDQNFNVCFIDDGSLDKTLDLLKKILHKGVGFKYKVYEQNNQGAAAARLKGINNAETAYITILDCDDKISEDYIEKVNKIISENGDLDILIPNAYIEKQYGVWGKLQFYSTDLFLDPKEALKNTLGGWKVHGWFTVKKSVFQNGFNVYGLYNKDKLNFINNDEVLTRIILINSLVIRRMDCVYYNCYNGQSTTKKVSPKRYLMYKNALIIKELFFSDDYLKVNCIEELVGVSWSLYRDLQKNKPYYENVKDWENAISSVLNEVDLIKFIFKLSFKHMVKLLYLKALF